MGRRSHNTNPTIPVSGCVSVSQMSDDGSKAFCHSDDRCHLVDLQSGETWSYPSTKRWFDRNSTVNFSKDVVARVDREGISQLDALVPIDFLDARTGATIDRLPPKFLFYMLPSDGLPYPSTCIPIGSWFLAVHQVVGGEPEIVFWTRLRALQSRHGTPHETFAFLPNADHSGRKLRLRTR